MTAHIIPFPVPTVDPDKAEYEKLLPKVAQAMEETGYLFSQQEVLHEICRPYDKGWVPSVEACFQRRTKADYLKMFERFNGGTFDLQGFRDEAEGMLCQEAALECRSSWRFTAYRDRDVRRGGTGLGCLNKILQDYTDAYNPDLFPNLLPAPPGKERSNL